MSVVFTEFPFRNFGDDKTTPSKWNAVHHPITFSAQRQDFKVSKVESFIPELNGWKISYPTFPEGLEVGQFIFLSSGTNNELLEVGSVTPFYCLVSSPTLSASTGGFLNLQTYRRNYLVETLVLGVDDSNTYYKVGVLESKPAPNGIFKISVNGLLKNISEFSEQLEDYRPGVDREAGAALNKKMVYEGSRFNIVFRESWVNYEGAFTDPSNSNVYYWTNSAKQLQDPYNTNMADHVPFLDKDKAKFLTSFVKPTYFPGFPFSVSFIYSEGIIARNILAVEDYYVGGVVVDSDATDLDQSMCPAVNRLVLIGGYNTLINELDLYLSDEGDNPILYVDSGYVDDGYTETQDGPPDILVPGDIDELG
jgi:hypothetical protein